MNFEDRKYVLIQASEVSNMDFEQLMEDGADTLHWNLAETETFVKFIGDTPDFLEGKTILTHAQIKVELATSDWNEPPPDPLP
tara:strand:- start:970 stop:1218 length:249 start_codon:yes stop_codon:yes gene_type:complete